MSTNVKDLEAKIAAAGGRIVWDGDAPEDLDGPEPVTDQKIIHPSRATRPDVLGGEPEFEVTSVPDRLTALDPRLSGLTGWDAIMKTPAPVASKAFGLSEDHVLELQGQNDDLFMMGQLLAQSREGEYATKSYPEIVLGLKMYRVYQEQWQRQTELAQAIKALDTTDASSFIPTGFSAELLRRVELDLVVGALFPAIGMPTNPYKLPIQGAPPTAYLIAEQTDSTGQTAITASQPGTSNLELSANKLAVRVLFSDELSEDSIVPILPYCQERMQRALAEAVEDCIINGDDSGTHFDTGRSLGATSHLKAFKGLRYTQQQQTSAAEVDFSTCTLANVLALRREMAKYGLKSAEGVWITSMAGVATFMASITQVQTLEVFGPRAIVLVGEMAKLLGSPVVVSDAFPDDLNASGIYDASDTSYTAALYVHKGSFIRGLRSSNVESDRILEYGQVQVVATIRLTFSPLFANTTENMVGLGHKLAKT